VYFLLAPVSLAVTINVRCRTMHLNLRILLCFFLLSPPGGVGKDYVVRLVLFVCLFVRSDLSLTTISHERLEQYWWNLQGIFTSPYWWLDYILEVKSWRSRSLLAVEVAEASTSTLVRQCPCYVHAYCVLCYGSFLFGAIHMLSLLTVTFLVWVFLVDVCFCYVRFSLSSTVLSDWLGTTSLEWSSLGYPHPHQCAKFRTFAPRSWGGRIFWKFSNLQTRVRGPKRGDTPRITRTGYRSGSCAILSTNGAKNDCGGLFFDLLPQLASVFDVRGVQHCVSLAMFVWNNTWLSVLLFRLRQLNGSCSICSPLWVFSLVTRQHSATVLTIILLSAYCPSVCLSVTCCCSVKTTVLNAVWFIGCVMFQDSDVLAGTNVLRDSISVKWHRGVVILRESAVHQLYDIILSVLITRCELGLRIYAIF